MKRVFLTGASSGIGQAIADVLLANGHEVWGTSRHPETLPNRERFHHVGMDLLQPNQVEDAFRSATREAEFFNVVINNAGSGHFGPAEFLSRDDLLEQFQVVFFSHVRLMQLALAEMRRRDSGLIINVSSLAALLPVPFMAAYNAAKAAMASLTISTRLELGKSRVRIVDLQPGDICTNFNDVIKRGNCAPGYEVQMDKTWNAVDHNLRRAPKPEIVAKEILKLMNAKDPPPLVTVGDTFQTKIAPFIFRFLPQTVRLWGLKIYYGI